MMPGSRNIEKQQIGSLGFQFLMLVAFQEAVQNTGNLVKAERKGTTGQLLLTVDNSSRLTG